jgi:hypothetical protein
MSLFGLFFYTISFVLCVGRYSSFLKIPHWSFSFSFSFRLSVGGLLSFFRSDRYTRPCPSLMWLLSFLLLVFLATFSSIHFIIHFFNIQRGAIHLMTRFMTSDIPDILIQT